MDLTPIVFQMNNRIQQGRKENRRPLVVEEAMTTTRVNREENGGSRCNIRCGSEKGKKRGKLQSRMVVDAMEIRENKRKSLAKVERCDD
ncbi:hypothetical protein GOBAR_AA26309 [Gossypium barbadense]|uniref:Uncharacterized protein n=1 Tax=Gossypium barbadense TaxID=3634 RepID=A0A2P5WTG6_GOSBA|nr:hypothetical protein GOBAR_AA26309 [Gossypium barbadense]